MRLWITKVELRNFRNYETFSLEPDPGLTVLVGPNAIGKTNIIEAVALVTEGDSFRTSTWSELIGEAGDEASVSLHAQGEAGRRVEIDLSVRGGRRAYTVNGVRKRAVTEVAGVVPAVVFTPDDLRMVKGAADRRRAAIDSLGTQISKAYGAVRVEYERIVRQRNALLKEGDVAAHELTPWTERLIEVGAHLTIHRIRLFARLAPHLSRVYRSLSDDEHLEVEYTPSWDEADAADHESRDATTGAPRRAGIGAAIRSALAEREPEERARRTTLVGPHRDDIRFSIGGREARAYASQGQQRTAALAWKLAEIEVIEDITGTTPVLLLDDVMSELDEERRHALTSFVGDRTQTFVTTTNLGYFNPSLIEAAMVVRLG